MSWMKENVDPECATKQLLQTQCGTAKYMAPETIVRTGKGYDGEKVDAWECGMVLYALLAGYLPFNGEDDSAVFQAILRGKLKFPSHFSPGAKDLLRRLLEKDPELRLTLPQVREHLWFLVDYAGDAAVAAATSTPAAERLEKPAPAGAQRVKLGHSFKKTKSRSRLSQRIRQGALKLEAVVSADPAASPDVQLVPAPLRNKSTVRFVGNKQDRADDDGLASEQIVDEGGDETTSGHRGPSSAEATAGATGIGAIVLADAAAPSAGPVGPACAQAQDHAHVGVPVSKRQSRITTAASNLLKVPSLGMFFADPRDGAAGANKEELDHPKAAAGPAGADEEGGGSVRSRLKSPIASMFKSMLSTSSSPPPVEADGGELTGQSSWFASSPVSDAGAPHLPPNPLDRMVSEDELGDSKVTSFNKFLKRPRVTAKK